MSAVASQPVRRAYARYELASVDDVLAAAAAVRDHACLAGLGSDDVDALTLVVAELGDNAVRHGSGGELRVEASPAGWVVRAEDRGAGFPPELLARTGRRNTPAEVLLLEGGGSGLALVRRLAGSVELFNLRCGAVAVARRVVTPGR